MIGILNAHMFGTLAAPGEHVNWSTPDVDTPEGWYGLLGVTVEEYAATSPHMIVFEVIEWDDLLLSDEPVSIPDPAEAAAERARSYAYATEYGYDVDPVTGRYLPPVGERDE